MCRFFISCSNYCRSADEWRSLFNKESASNSLCNLFRILELDFPFIYNRGVTFPEFVELNFSFIYNRGVTPTKQQAVTSHNAFFAQQIHFKLIYSLDQSSKCARDTIRARQIHAFKVKLFIKRWFLITWTQFLNVVFKHRSKNHEINDMYYF